MEMSNKRLNMEHGFMQSIRRIQVDRDNYDKEVKAIKDNQTVSIGAVSQQSQTGCKQHKKPDRETYLPPTRRKPPDPSERILLFEFQFLDQTNNCHCIDVYKTDDPIYLARQISQSINLNAAMSLALVDFLKSKMREEQDSSSSNDDTTS